MTLKEFAHRATAVWYVFEPFKSIFDIDEESIIMHTFENNLYMKTIFILAAWETVSTLERNVVD